MRQSRIYLDKKLIAGDTLSLTGDAGHYVGRVLRLRPGDGLALFNASDGEFMAEVVQIERNRLTVRVLEPVDNRANPRLHIQLGLGLSKGERMDYAIQKATELGVYAITPLVTGHCEVRLDEKRLGNKLQHWQRVAISACEQCGRSHIPSIATPQPLADWLAAHPHGILLDHRGSVPLRDAIQPLASAQDVNLLVGPEGGFSDSELDSAVQQGYAAVALGPRILRTETAPVAGLTLIQFLLGDLDGG